MLQEVRLLDRPDCLPRDGKLPSLGHCELSASQ